MGGSPFMEADVSKKIVFDESAKNIKPQSCSCWFLRFYTCEEIVGPENLDTSSVLDMSNMFAFFASDLKVVPALDLNNCNTSNVINMTKMFYRYAMNSALTPELNISNWNTSSVSNMFLMFYEFAMNTKAQLTLDVSKWDTGMIEDMSDMFSGFASNSTLPPILDVSDWDTSNVKNMSEMFCHFSYLSKEPPKLNVSNWDTSNVSNMSNMFRFFACCTKASPFLDLRNWDTSNVSNMSGMFNGFSYFSSEPATIYASKKFCVDNVTDSFNMFFSSNIQGGAGTAYNSNHANIDGACIDILDGEWGSSKGYFTGDTAAVEFYANGAEGVLPVTLMYALNYEFVLPDKGKLISPDGSKFFGWAIGSVSGEIKQPGDVIIINKYTPVYATWENDTYSVVLYTNGGTIAEGCDVSSYVYVVGAILPKKVKFLKLVILLMVGLIVLSYQVIL